MLDAPSESPRLGFERIADALSEIAVQSDPRFAVGIFGGWGTGKTTLMRAIETRLRTHDVVCVRFVAWRYEREEHLIVPLLDAIRDELMRWADERGGDRVAQRTATTIGRVVRSLVAGMSVKVGVSGAVEASFDANRSLQEHTRLREAKAAARVPRSFYHASFRALETAFDDFARASGGRRIVVFVDDLDRCLPENALQVLESMKLFFDLEGFVFVVGLDDDVIEYAVEAKYTGQHAQAAGRAHRISGREYLQKVFQLPYRLAPVSGGQLGEFLRSAAEEAGMAPEQRLDLRRVVEPHLRFLVRDGTVNPREVKRYVNLYTLQVHINDTLDPDVVLALQTISFRGDWQQNVWHPLLEFREEYVEALRRHVAIGGDGAAALGESLHAFPADIVDYVRTGAPGHALLLAEDLDRYLSAGEAVRSTRSPALLEALGAVGEIHRRLRAAIDDDNSGPEVGEALAALLSTIESRVAATAGDTPAGGAVLDTIRRFQRALNAALASGDPAEDALAHLPAQAVALSKELRRLYRAGDLGAGRVPAEDGQDDEPGAPGAGTTAPDEPPPPPPPLPVSSQPLPVRRMASVSPYELGVGREAGDGAAAYIPRDVDERLREALSSAIGTGLPALIAVCGPPASGKTRTLYEIAAATAPQALVYVPESDSQLLELLDREALRGLPDEPVLVWLDAIERFAGVSGALNGEVVAALTRLRRRVVLLATVRTGDASYPAVEALLREPWAEAIPMDVVLTEREREQVVALASPSVAVAADAHGLGPSLLAVDALMAKLQGTPRDPVGTAIVYAAIDWSRAGMPSAVPDETLRALAALYLPQAMTNAEFRRGLAWALAPVKGSTALLVREEDGVRAPEWIVDSVDDSERPIDPELWHRILTLARSEEALLLGRVALARGDRERALAAFKRAARSTRPQIAATASTQVGRLLLADDAEYAWAPLHRGDELGDPEAPALIGARYESEGDLEGAERAYHRSDERGSAEGTLRLGDLLQHVGDHDGAEAAYLRAIDRGSTAASRQLGTLLRRRGDLDAAAAAYSRADEAGDPIAAVNLGGLLHERGDLEGAEAAFRRAEERGSADAAFNLALLLTGLDRTEEAAAARRRYHELSGADRPPEDPV